MNKHVLNAYGSHTVIGHKMPIYYLRQDLSSHMVHSFMECYKHKNKQVQ